MGIWARQKTKTKTQDRQGAKEASASTNKEIVSEQQLAKVVQRAFVTGPCSSKPSPTYTGKNIIGIAQMSKSNAIPVFDSEHIIEIARMRR